MGDEEKGTAAAEGQEEPGWDEVLEFAVSGQLASQEDAEITVRVWDHHWVRHSSSLLELWWQDCRLVLQALQRTARWCCLLACYVWGPLVLFGPLKTLKLDV